MRQERESGSSNGDTERFERVEADLRELKKQLENYSVDVTDIKILLATLNAKFDSFKENFNTQEEAKAKELEILKVKQAETARTQERILGAGSILIVISQVVISILVKRL